jgi:predicted phosphoadenosine phosphosulfate sulfurtransferase
MIILKVICYNIKLADLWFFVKNSNFHISYLYKSYQLIYSVLETIFFFISNIYIHIPGFTFTLINYGKISCFIATNGSCQPITSTERTKMIFLLVELKGMLHHQYRRVKNFITWYHITITLCLVFNSTSRKFHGFGVPIIG